MPKNARFSVTSLGFVLTLLKNIGHFLLIHFPFQIGAEIKNQSTITTPKLDDRHKNIKKKTRIIVKSIHSLHRSESKTIIVSNDTYFNGISFLLL